MRKIFAGILIIALVAVMFSGCVVIETGKSNSGVNKEKVESNHTAKETDPTEAADTEFGFDEAAVFDTIKITAMKLEETKGKQYMEAGDGKIFVGVQFTIENISEEEQNISSILLFDAYIDGVKCEYSFMANTAFEEGTLDGAIAPGKKMIGWYGVETAEDWGKLEIQVKAEWLSSTAATFVFENK